MLTGTPLTTVSLFSTSTCSGWLLIDKNAPHWYPRCRSGVQSQMQRHNYRFRWLWRVGPPGVADVIFGRTSSAAPRTSSNFGSQYTPMVSLMSLCLDCRLSSAGSDATLGQMGTKRRTQGVNVDRAAPFIPFVDADLAGYRVHLLGGRYLRQPDHGRRSQQASGHVEQRHNARQFNRNGLTDLETSLRLQGPEFLAQPIAEVLGQVVPGWGDLSHGGSFHPKHLGRGRAPLRRGPLERP